MKKKVCSLLSICTNNTYEGMNRIGKFSIVRNCSIGKYTYIGDFSSLDSCRIGSFSSLSAHIKIIYGSHKIDNNVTTHPVFEKKTQWKSLFSKSINHDNFNFVDGKEKIRVIIGNDVWIGYGAKIMEGVIVGDGAIIAAMSLVTKDVPPYAVVGGIPAKIIKYRFDTDIINYLSSLKWWDKSENWIIKYSKFFDDVNELIKKINDGDN